MPLTLDLQKPGDAPKPKLQLSMSKARTERFAIELYWNDGADLDAHALEATNSGSGALVSELEQVLSCYNVIDPKNPKRPAVLKLNSDGKSFNLPSGSLHHSGDVADGTKADVDEIITFDGAKAPADVNEVPIFVTVASPKGANPAPTFATVKDAGIRIKNDDGKVLIDYNLSHEFGPYNAVQMGSLVFGDNGWEFAPIGAGFMGDFQTVLNSFS